MGGVVDLSVVIPSRNEQFLRPTIQSILDNAETQVEVIAVLDGYWPPQQEIINDPRVIYLHRGDPQGMRPGINAGMAIAKGEHVMKLDGHCMVDKGFDRKLIADCESNWVAVPRRHRLDADNWCLQDVRKPPIDYMFLSYPDDPNDWGGPGFHGKVWNERNARVDLKDILIDDLMSSQGSGWFMHRDYFYDLELMDTENWGTFWSEFQEIGFKCWLSGGRVVVNKNTWYAHFHKGKRGRGYLLDKQSLTTGANYAKRWATERVWHKQTLPFSSMIERFMPVPSWDEQKLDDLKRLEWKPEISIITSNVKRRYRAYVNASLDSRGLQRVASALYKYSGNSVDIVQDENKADIVILHVTGRRDKILARANEIKARGQKYAVIQYCLRSTQKPSTADWIDLWRNAEIVWSYYDLPALCEEDDVSSDFNYYVSPLGVEADVFYPKFVAKSIAIPKIIMSTGLGYLTESVREVIAAARSVHGWDAWHLGADIGHGVPGYVGITDDVLADIYNSCHYVSGLRRKEGFELPVVEGLFCGVRPILFDQPHYRQWFDQWGVFIPETNRDGIIQSLCEVLSNEYRPVTVDEIAVARKLFYWPEIIDDFWKAAYRA